MVKGIGQGFDLDFDGHLLHALIFDVDGTLADTERDLHRVAFNHAFQESGLDWCWDVATYGRLLKVTGGKERIRHYMQTHLGRPAGEDDGLALKLHALKTDIYVSLIESHAVSLRPGVERLLLEARRAGLRLAIATTTTPANVRALLEATLGDEALRWFEVIGAGDVVPNKKPAPDIYRYVLERLRLPASACIAFEDSANGLQAALGAGLPTIVTPSAYTANEDFSGAWSVLSDLGEPFLPCRTLAGHAPECGVVDTEQLDAWHAAMNGAMAY